MPVRQHLILLDQYQLVSALLINSGHQQITWAWTNVSSKFFLSLISYEFDFCIEKFCCRIKKPVSKTWMSGVTRRLCMVCLHKAVLFGSVQFYHGLFHLTLISPIFPPLMSVSQTASLALWREISLLRNPDHLVQLSRACCVAPKRLLI